jgi:hypothetical protein
VRRRVSIVPSCTTVISLLQFDCSCDDHVPPRKLSSNGSFQLLTCRFI